MTPSTDTSKAITWLQQFVTTHKQQRIREVLAYRTYYLTVVLEDIYQPQNASAVLRSCDCFGIQQAHIIENRNTYTLNKGVTQGAEKWVDRVHYNKAANNTPACLSTLRQKGYRIVATTPEAYDCLLPELPLDQKVAICFGTELEGLSEAALDAADVRVKIPMYGFTQSFNLSVSAALTLYELTRRLHHAKTGWQLTKAEKEALTLQWYRRITNMEPPGI